MPQGLAINVPMIHEYSRRLRARGYQFEQFRLFRETGFTVSDPFVEQIWPERCGQDRTIARCLRYRPRAESRGRGLTNNLGAARSWRPLGPGKSLRMTLVRLDAGRDNSPLQPGRPPGSAIFCVHRELARPAWRHLMNAVATIRCHLMANPCSS